MSAGTKTIATKKVNILAQPRQGQCFNVMSLNII